MPPRKRLTREDWTTAALAALRREGPDAIAVEPVAAALGATKGSGYWHFGSRAELLAETMTAWRRESTDALIDTVERRGGSPAERMARLLVVVTAAVEESPVEALLIGSTEPAVRAAVRGAVEARIGYLERLLLEAGVGRRDARPRAALAYSAYLGYAMLAAAAPASLPTSTAARRRMQSALLGLVLPADTTDAS